MVYQQLAEASKQHPGPVLGRVKRLVVGAEENGGDQYMLTEHAVSQVIAAALDSDDPETGANATSVMHELSEQGYIDLAAKVAALRQH